MSRSTHFYGLSEKAQEWLQENGAIKYKKVTTLFDEDGQEVSSEYQIIPKTNTTEEVITGICGETVHTIAEYQLKNGEVVIEFIELEIWSGGPHIYLALKNKQTQEIIPESSWKDIEDIIDNHVLRGLT